MSERSRDNVIELIQGLLAKTAERGATQAEAEMAAAKVQELLAKYNLSMAAVGTPDGRGTPVGELMTYLEKGAGKQWLATLANVVGRAGFCRVITASPRWVDVRDGKAREDDAAFVFIGRDQNAQVCAELLRWLEHAIWEITLEDRKRLNLKGTRMGSFLMGMVSTISVRLHEQRVAQEAQEVTLRALVVRHEEDNKEYVRENYPYLRRVRSASVGNYEAYGQGQAAGGRVPLAPQSRQVKGG